MPRFSFVLSHRLALLPLALLTWGGLCPHAAADDAPQLAAADAPRGGEAKPTRSQAEYIARLQRAIEADRKQLDTLTCQVDDPQSDYHRAQAAFERLDAKRAAALEQIETLRRKNRPADADALEEQLDTLEEDWQEAKERFDLALKVRKTLREKANSLQDKIARDTQTLESLLADPAEEDKPRPMQPAQPAAAIDITPEEPAEEVPITKVPATPLEAAKAVATGVAAMAEDEHVSVALLAAQRELEERQTEATAAADRAKSIEERVEALEKNIAVEEQLLMLARAKADQAQQSWSSLNRHVSPDLLNNKQQLDELSRKIEDAANRFGEAQRESEGSHERLADLRSQLTAVQQEQADAAHDAEVKLAAANAAQGKVERLRNPFTPTNIVQWILDHGPKLLAILIGTLSLYLFVKFTGRHLVAVMAKTGSRGTFRERENRALTLVGVFRNVAGLAIVGGGTLMLLDEVGIPILPLMGGAAVVGLAVAFGAQNLVRDYFSGFMVLLEDQYGINDVVRIGDVAGAVEQITLRVTVLRDLEGTMHFIPHGSITRVSNMTHGWSRAVIEVPVAYKEDPDRVMAALLEVARDLRRDPALGPFILDDPEMLGVDSFAESAMMIKLTVKTHPLKRWPVKREMQRRIKNRLAGMGISIPVPHRAVYLHNESDAASAPDAARPSGQRAA